MYFSFLHLINGMEKCFIFITPLLYVPACMCVCVCVSSCYIWKSLTHVLDLGGQTQVSITGYVFKNVPSETSCRSLPVTFLSAKTFREECSHLGISTVISVSLSLPSPRLSLSHTHIHKHTV